MFYAYIIKSKTTGKIYIGQTSNYKKRLERHNQILPTKKKSYTSKNKGPWELVYLERFKTRKEAINREKELKSYRGRAFIKTIVKDERARSSVGRATAF